MTVEWSRRRLGASLLACALAVVTFGGERAAAQAFVADVGVRHVPAQSGVLQAGFARVDITPPPGLGLQGFGPEGREARGFRQRLYVRVLALVDAHGQRLALAVADLQAISPGLHLKSVKLAEGAKLEFHELLLAATHTHAAPSHYFDAAAFNEVGSSLAGFDKNVLAFFAERIATALDSAFHPANLEPARAAWGSTLITGASRNRSYEPYLANTGLTPPGFPAPIGLAVDRTWTMLRVETLRQSDEKWVPAGAFSIFGVHPTIIPANNDLYEADLHGYVNRRLERFIDAEAKLPNDPQAPDPHPDDPRPHSVHLWANGAEGDVSPTWQAGTRCPLPRLRRGLRPSGARAPRRADHWEHPGATAVARCMSLAFEEVRRIGDLIADSAERLFLRLEPALSDTVTISRAFRALELPGHQRNGLQRLPDAPLAGSAFLGGAEDGRSRFYRWRDLGLFPAGAEEGAASRDVSNKDLFQRPKRKALPLLYGILAEGKLPTLAQLMVARIGGRYLVSVPAEVTTVASFRLTEAVRRAATTAGDSVARAVLVGLANGYLLYLTTPEEYELQHYEGGANLYGGQTLSVFEEEYGDLTRSLFASPERVSLAPTRERLHHTPLLPEPGRRSPGDRRILGTSCDANSVTVRWEDEAPGDLIPADGLLLRMTHIDRAQQRTVMWDDDLRVEVSAGRGGLFRNQNEWKARFFVEPLGQFEFTLLERQRQSGTTYPELNHPRFELRPFECR
jgi:neutral ceramidase